MGFRATCDKETLLNEYLPMIFDQIYNLLKNDELDEAIKVMDELNITNDQFKEHVVTLLFDKKRADKLNKLSTKTKTAFTKAYNNLHKTSLKAKKKKREGANDVEKDQFDPDRDEEEEVMEEEDSEETEYEIEQLKGKKSKAKGKAKPKSKTKGKKKK